MNRKLWGIIALFTIIRLFVGLNNGLGVDEAHYVLYGLWPDLSYFDHPPLVGWLQVPFAQLGDRHVASWEFLARIPALAIGVLSSLLVYRWLRLKEFSESHALWGVTALNLSLIFEGLSIFFLPDSLFLIFVPALAIAITHLENSKKLKSWLILGLVLGLCGLSKYTAFLFVIALGVRWIQQKSLRDLTRSSFWLAVIIAGILIAPILIWNRQHAWISFKYQSGHVLSWNNLKLGDILFSQLSQFVGLGFFYLWMLKMIFKEKAWSFERILITVCWFFICLCAILGNFLPHWTAPAFVLGIPWGVASALKKDYFTHSLKAAFVAATILFAIANTEMIFHWAPSKITRYFYRDIQGWPEYVRKLSETAELRNRNLAVTNWTFGSRFTLFSEHRNNLYILDHRFDQFDLWNPLSPIGKNFLIAVEPKLLPSFKATIRCSKLEILEILPLSWHDQELISFELLDCEDFHWAN